MALYDPREFPEAETVSPDFTLEEFLAWVRTKPADEAYDFWDIRGCAIYLFCKDRGLPIQSAGGSSWTDIDDAVHFIFGPGGEPTTAFAAEPSTFGALAARLEAELSQ